MSMRKGDITDEDVHLKPCASEQIGQFGSCTLSTTAVLRALQGFGACTRAHLLKHPGLGRLSVRQRRL